MHPLHGEDNETLQQRADIAMYSAKQSGRGFAHLRARARPPLAAPPRARRRHAPGDQRGPDPALLPAQGRPAHGPDHGRRGARALGSPGVRHRRPERVRADRRADRPDHAADLVRARRRDRPGAQVEGRRAWSSSIAVNLSARSFLDTQLAVEIPRLLRQAGTSRRELLELEITETMLMTDPARAEATLTRLSQIGLTLSVDDFGTGYSSLANLKRLPVDVIKIDKSFVIEMAVDASDAAIVRSTIDLAHNLGLRVVAEGVESEDALAPARGARLRLRPGLLPLPPAPRRGGDAADPRARHRPRRRPARTAGRAGPRRSLGPSRRAHDLLQRFTGSVRFADIRGVIRVALASLLVLLTLPAGASAQSGGTPAGPTASSFSASPSSVAPGATGHVRAAGDAGRARARRRDRARQGRRAGQARPRRRQRARPRHVACRRRVREVHRAPRRHRRRGDARTTVRR